MATEEKNQLRELTEEELKAVNGGGDFKPCIPELLKPGEQCWHSGGIVSEGEDEGAGIGKAKKHWYLLQITVSPTNSMADICDSHRVGQIYTVKWIIEELSDENLKKVIGGRPKHILGAPIAMGRKRTRDSLTNSPLSLE